MNDVKKKQVITQHLSHIAKSQHRLVKFIYENLYYQFNIYINYFPLSFEKRNKLFSSKLNFAMNYFQPFPKILLDVNILRCIITDFVGSRYSRTDLCVPEQTHQDKQLQSFARESCLKSNKTGVIREAINPRSSERETDVDTVGERFTIMCTSTIT